MIIIRYSFDNNKIVLINFSSSNWIVYLQKNVDTFTGVNEPLHSKYQTNKYFYLRSNKLLYKNRFIEVQIVKKTKDECWNEINGCYKLQKQSRGTYLRMEEGAGTIPPPQSSIRTDIRAAPTPPGADVTVEGRLIISWF